MADRIPDAPAVKKLWDKAEKALTAERRAFWLNMAFYSGDQWLTWNEREGWLEAMAERADGDPHRITVNKIGSRLDGLVGRFIARKLAWESQPTGTDSGAHRGGRLAEFILDSENEERDYEGIRQENLINTITGGTSAIAVHWDGEAGDSYTEPSSGETVHTGVARLESLCIAEFSLQPGVRRVEDAAWWVAQTVEPPEVVQDRYGMKVKPKPDAKAALSSLQRKLLRNSQGDDELVKVLRYYRRPTRTDPIGCEVHVVGTQVVRRIERWAFPFEDRLNLRVFRCRPNTRQWIGQTFMNGVRSPQVSINEIHSNILDHIDMVCNANMLMPHGSVMNGQTPSNLAGQIVDYYGEAGKPEWMAPPEMPRYPREEIDRLTADIDDQLYTHATSRGELVGSRNSGLALSLVTEKDDSPLSVMARDQATGWGELGTMVLQMYEDRVTVPRRSARRTDVNTVIDKEWIGPDLNGQTRVRVPIDAALPNSKVATQALMIQMKNAFPEQFARMDPVTIAKSLELPIPNLMGALVDHQAAFAEFENEQMFDYADGEFDQDKVMVPRDWDDHAVHIAQHNRARNTPAYYYATPEVQALFDDHVRAHARLAQEELLGQEQLNAALPGAEAMPQADAPPGSAIPPTSQEQMAQLAMTTNGSAPV